MIKQLIAISIAAAFGIAHAADVKPAAAEAKPGAPAAAAVVKTETPKVADAVKAPDAKPVAVAPEVKKDEVRAATKPAKKAKKVAKPVAAEPAAPVAAVDAAKK